MSGDYICPDAYVIVQYRPEWTGSCKVRVCLSRQGLLRHRLIFCTVSLWCWGQSIGSIDLYLFINRSSHASICLYILLQGPISYNWFPMFYIDIYVVHICIHVKTLDQIQKKIIINEVVQRSNILGAVMQLDVLIFLKYWRALKPQT